MKHDALIGRAPHALCVLVCLLSFAGCKGSDDSGDDPGRNESLLDASSGPAEDAAIEIEDARVGPDGAVQIREEPDESCAAVSGPAGDYFFCSTPLQASVAVGTCWDAGSTLVTIDDADENQFLVDEMVEDEYWIGISDATEEDDFVWAVGSPGSSFENWDESQPGLDDFVYINRENGRWATSTDVPRPYICELWR